MKKTGLFIFCIIFHYSLSAQTSGQVAQYSSNVGITDALYNYAMGSVSDKIEKLKYEDATILGSPYLSNSFNSGQLYYGDESVGKIYYRYNAYNEEIEIKQTNSQDETIRSLSKDKKIRLIDNGKSISFKTFVDKIGYTKNGYMTLLSDGNYKLYKHLKVTFKEAKKAENTFVKSTPAKFSQFTEYYIERPEGKRIDQVELSNKKILRLLDNEKVDALKLYLKENNIKVKGEKDLIKVVNFLNGKSSDS